ncbi:MAG TPA: isochorismatase family protein [Gaiellaceae bacterium]|nr:isochorismatase family protein [Gaiellaceae bacterium]
MTEKGASSREDGRLQDRDPRERIPVWRKHEGFHGRAGFGRRPALVVIDVNRGFTDPASPLVCDLDDVVDAIAQLLDAFRAAGLPVAYTTVAYDEAARRSAEAFIAKIPALLTLEAGSEWVEIDPRIAPRADEPVFTKLWASAFHGTPFASFLAAAGCDSLVVTGASTSGCVRATAVDALQHGYRPLVPREAVGDRDAAAHEANLYDIDTKYGDVVSLAETLAALGELVPG